MKTKCKPVHSQAMQLQIHPGLVSKAEDVKSLVWLIPFLRGDVLHCASLYTYTKLLCDPVHHRPSCAISTLPKSQKLLQCQHNWSPAVRRLPLPPHLFIEMPKFLVYFLYGQTCFGPVPFRYLDFWVALHSPSFYIGKGNPESICSLPLPHEGKSLVTANCSEFFCIKMSIDSWACLMPTSPPTKAKRPETWTAAEPINTSTSSPKTCLSRHSLPIQAATAA